MCAIINISFCCCHLQLNKQEKTITSNTNSTRSSVSSASSKKSRPDSNRDRKRCKTSSSTLKLDLFYDKIRRTSHSTPLVLEKAPVNPRCNDNYNRSTSTSDMKKELSPYPFNCLSPSDKAFENPPPSDCSSSEWGDPLESHLTEHSYTTKSAGRVDLTSESQFYMSCRRTDVSDILSTFVKIEPLSDNYEEAHSSSFRPIEAFVCTPPRPHPSGSSIELSVIKAIPRNLSFEDPLPPSAIPNHVQNNTSSLNRYLTEDTNPGPSSPSRSPCSVSNDSLNAVGLNPTILGDNMERQKGKVPENRYRKMGGKSSTQSSTHFKSTKSETASSCLSKLSESAVEKPSGLGCTLNQCSDNKDSEDNVNLGEDNFISDSAPLLIPLEPNFNVYNIENEVNHAIQNSNIDNDATLDFDDVMKTYIGESNLVSSKHGEVNGKPNSLSDNENKDVDSSVVECSKLKPGNSNKVKVPSTSKSRTTKSVKNRKGHPLSNNMSIIQFCTSTSTKSVDEPTTSRKRKASVDSDVLSEHNNHQNELMNEDVDGCMSQEEKDHLLAIQLQDMYSKMDNYDIRVDRHKGSKDEYLFRKRRCR